jgi:hypothetical protein
LFSAKPLQSALPICPSLCCGSGLLPLLNRGKADLPITAAAKRQQQYPLLLSSRDRLCRSARCFAAKQQRSAMPICVFMYLFTVLKCYLFYIFLYLYFYLYLYFICFTVKTIDKVYGQSLWS